MQASAHSVRYLAATSELAGAVDPTQIDELARGLAAVRSRGGRLFVLGVGGGAGHASHAVNDFRKLCAIESYAPTDNVSELTARTNDDGWETSFSAWLEVSRLSGRDALLVFSVGGGSREHNVSTNLVNAMEAAARWARRIYGVVGAPGGTLAELADVAILHRSRRQSCARRWSSPSRPSSGTRSCPTPSSPSKQGHWESLAAADARDGDAPRSR